MNTDPKTHWETVYRTRAADAVSWYRPHLERSLALMRRVAGDPNAALIDVGGGASTLVDDLVAAGYRDVSVLDIAETALEAARGRLGPRGEGIRWIAGDVTSVRLEPGRYDVWHDRAVFHFLTDASARRAYAGQIERAVRRGGHVVLATFGPEGPAKCSGLDVMRYDAHSLGAELGEHLQLLEGTTELHSTPSGTTQQFLYCLFEVA